jgi:hypothetical protein
VRQRRAIHTGLIVIGVPCAALACVAAWVLGSCRDDTIRCETGTEYCPDVDECVNTSNSTENCGQCGTVCSDCWRCIMGQCTPACCAEEFDCADPVSELDCVVLSNDREHCGDCAVACADDEICRNGSCERCEPPAARCDNACADLSTSMQHCGHCDNPCTGDTGYCVCGECVGEASDAACPGPDGDADTDTDSDADGDHDADGDADHDGDHDADGDADHDG